MASLSDAERDACDVMQALAGLAALLGRPAEDRPGLDPYDPRAEEFRQLLLGMAAEGSLAAARLVAYLREQRGAGDGELAMVPLRLGEWRDWVPPRGHLFAAPADHQPDGVAPPRRSDPGE